MQVLYRLHDYFWPIMSLLHMLQASKLLFRLKINICKKHFNIFAFLD